ncbi:thiazole synthase [Candidatus Cyanaurora vandensis]|uniref:thiazole synthase n=1 Tax=Candidatus Cyanaurora vandensis TaxID=2714958 RepID=UPI00257EB6A6|nr:thiazole synthase [Candidatus Cyanaurora vandensis]
MVPTISELQDPLRIAGRTFTSRLILGTGKYRTLGEMQQALAASSCEIVTVAVRRVQMGQEAPGHQGLAQAIDWQRYWLLPNTAGCTTADEALRAARLGRELCRTLGQEDNNWVKLEVIRDPKYLLPDPLGTLRAAEQLVHEGFAVLPYIHADPELARRLWELGTVTVMPLGSPIGSGQGLKNRENIAIIIENSPVPVVVDAGIAVPSEAAQAMELGAEAVLVNTAIAQAQNAGMMALAMAGGVRAGRVAFRAGPMVRRVVAQASSPVTGLVGSL